MERPLKLNFAFSTERINAVLAQKPILKLSDEARELLEKTLRNADEEHPDLYKNREAFLKVLKPLLNSTGLKLPSPLFKAVLAGLATRDETADICTDTKGKPEADPDLRDTENVPLTEDIQAYFEREVLLHVPDAWIDESKTKVGYEIPFTRHFYKYAPPRPLEEIDADLNKLVGEITALLSEVEK